MKKINSEKIDKIKVTVTNLDSAFDDIKNRLIKEKGLTEEKAKEQAGKILSSSMQKKKKEIKVPSLQKRNQLGRWVDISDPEEFLKDLSKWKDISTNEIIRKLENKEEFYYDTEWYAKLRIKPSEEETKKQKEQIEASQKRSLQYQKEEEERYQREVGKYEKM